MALCAEAKAFASRETLHACLFPFLVPFLFPFLATSSSVERVHTFIAFINDMPTYLTAWSAQLGPWSYVALFAVIFCETGLVVTPFLPGDSLLFALGALTAAEGAYLDPVVLGLLLWIAALSGDVVNYSIGKALGLRLVKSPRRFVNPAYLKRTGAFFELHGGKTVVLARFAPILRTYAPFVAGMARMRFVRFIAFSAGGGAAWIGAFLAAGYKFGNVPSVKSNFHLAILAIVVISLAPAAIEFWRARRHRVNANERQPGSSAT